MKINISGHQLEVTQAIHSHAKDKLNKIGAHFQEIHNIDISISIDKNKSVAELNTLFSGQSFTITEKHKDMYQAITRASKRLNTALKHKKSMLQSSRNNKLEEMEVLQHHEHLQNLAL